MWSTTSCERPFIVQMEQEHRPKSQKTNISMISFPPPLPVSLSKVTVSPPKTPAALLPPSPVAELDETYFRKDLEASPEEESDQESAVPARGPAPSRASHTQRPQLQRVGSARIRVQLDTKPEATPAAELAGKAAAARDMAVHSHFNLGRQMSTGG